LIIEKGFKEIIYGWPLKVIENKFIFMEHFKTINKSIEDNIVLKKCEGWM
jgi:hypothetical protein